jgi:hypothetical protein
MGIMSRSGLYTAITGVALVFSSAAAQNIYPPSNVMQVGSNVNLELRQVWTSAIAGKDEDGDWTGNVRGRDGTQGKLFAFSGEQGSFIFQVIYGNNTSEYCILEDRSSASGNRNTAVYEGYRFYKANRDSKIVDDDADCRVTVNNGSNAVTQPTQQPAQPPTQPGGPPALPGASSNPPLTWPVKLEVSQRWEWRLGDRPVVYRSTFSGVDGNGVFNGTLLTDGSGDPVRSRTLQVFYASAQDTLAAYATDPEGGVTVCSFVGAKSLQNNVLVGETYFRRPGSSSFDVVANTPCRANLAGAATVIAPPTPPPAAAFPPQVSIGQRWSVSVPQRGSWTISVDQRDAKTGWFVGAATGTPSNGTGLFFFEDDQYIVMISYRSGSRTLTVGCALDADGVRGSSFEGDSVDVDLSTGDVDDTGTRCTVAPSGGGSVNSGNNSPTPSLSASLPPKVGQTWRIDASGFEPWTLVFNTIDDGDPTGTLKQGNNTGETFFSTTSNGLRIFYMLGNRTSNACVFQSNAQVRGASIGGGNLFSIRVVNDQPKFDDLNTVCTATLVGTNGTLVTTPSASHVALKAMTSTFEFARNANPWADLARVILK